MVEERTELVPATTTAVDRRRPGRPAVVSPALVGLLRGAGPVAPRFGGHSALRAAQGIMIGAAAGLACWTLPMLIRMLATAWR